MVAPEVVAAIRHPLEEERDRLRRDLYSARRGLGILDRDLAQTRNLMQARAKAAEEELERLRRDLATWQDQYREQEARAEAAEEELERLRLEADNARAAIYGMAAAVNTDRAARRAAEAQVARLREAHEAILWHVDAESIIGRIATDALAETSSRDGS